ncbi:hypothetical protein LUX34_23780 [Streptomyces werraensis]|nr:hypothetical protein [Streptomyces werraensis]
MSERLTPQREAEIDARAGHLYEYSTRHNDDWDVLAGENVPALLAELAAVRAERDQARAALEAEKSAHRFTLRQRNNRSTRLLHLRDLANTAAAIGDPLNAQALIAACRDTLAASVDDHKHCAEEA